MADQNPGEEKEAPKPEQRRSPDLRTPKGALLFMFIYLILIVVLWSDVYVRLLESRK